MEIKQTFLSLQTNLITESITVREALGVSNQILAEENIPNNDIYESLDVIKKNISSSEKHLDINSSLQEIPESVVDISSRDPIAESAENIIRITCGSHARINHQHSLKYWSGKEATIFYDPLMVGFSAEDDDLSQLGWGSMQTASLIAKSCHEANKCSVFKFRRVAVVLTRHPSKYAHFIRDRLTKIIWAHHISKMGPFDDYIFDYPLSDQELKCLEDLDIRANFHYAINLGRLFTLQSDLIVIIEVSSGLNLLPLLKEFMLKRVTIPAKKSKIYFSRGQKGSRRDASNTMEVEETMSKLGYTVVDLSELSYVEQLNYCAGSVICSGIHGAQLINGLLGPSLIEIHSFPYCTSPWAETMLKMARVLNIPYVPLLLSSTDQHSSANAYENKTIRDIRKSMEMNRSSPELAQTSNFYINAKTLADSISIAELIIKKL